MNRYAGTGREYNVTSAIHVEGVPPRMESISVLHSAFTGINVTAPDAPVVINNCTVQYNRGELSTIAIQSFYLFSRYLLHLDVLSRSIIVNNTPYYAFISGYGIYVNGSSGMAYISDCTVLENGADGIKYVHFDERPDDKLDRTDVFDLCTFPTTASQTFPVTISMEQSKYAPNTKRCPQVSSICSLA